MSLNDQFPIRIYVNKRVKKRNLLIYLSLFVVLLAILVPGFIQNGYTGNRDGAGIMVELMFIFLIYIEYKGISNKEPTMTITEQGIWIHKNIFQKMEEVAWSDIGIVDYKNSMIVFSSIHRDRYIARLPEKEQKYYYKQVKKLGEASLLWIETSEVDYPQQDFLNLVESLIIQNKKTEGGNEK